MAAKTQQDFLDLFDRIFPGSWIQPLKNGDGYELLQAFAAVCARVSQAIDNADQGSHILSAQDAVLASGTVQIARSSDAAGAVTVKTGTIVKTSKTGRRYVLVDDAIFGATDVAPVTVRAVAVAPGWEYNVRGQRSAADGTVLTGEIDTLDRPIVVTGDPSTPTIDTNLIVSQTSDMAGGSAGMLDQLGADRGVPRRQGEAADIYRSRVRQLPDTVSPDAIVRAMTYTLDPVGVTGAFLESFQVARFWGSPDPETAGFAGDPRTGLPLRSRWLNENNIFGAFVVAVPAIAAVLDHAAYASDPATTPAAHVSPSNGGARAYAFWGIPTTALASIVRPYWSGRDLGREAALKGLYDLLQRIKAGGVDAWIELV